MSDPKPPGRRARSGTTVVTGEEGHFVTTEQAARMLGVSAKTVQIWTDEGHFAATRTSGGHRRIPLPALERALAERGARMGTSVLVVEDDPALARWYELALATNADDATGALEVSVATDAMHALLRIAKERPDVIVTDLRMSPLSGFDLMDALLSDRGKARSVGLVVVTGISEIELASNTRLPAHALVLRKPVTEHQLRKAIATAKAQRDPF